jgi:GGDEF domain-containing protein
MRTEFEILKKEFAKVNYGQPMAIAMDNLEKKIIEIEKDFQKSLSKMKIDVKAGIDIGFAYYRKKETYESLMDRADERMYKIKESRK